MTAAERLKQILAFLDPRSRVGGWIGRIFTLGLLAAILAALLIPTGPTSLTEPGLDVPKEEADLAGELTAMDSTHLTFRSLTGAAVDYPTPGEFLTANGIGFEYVAPNVPNFGYPPGTHGQVNPVVIVLHVAGGSCDGMKSWFKNRNSSASSQFGVCDDGSVDQYVEIEDAAYTQGVVNNPDGYIAVYGGVNPNLLSVSIELEGSCDGSDISQHPKQEATLRMLLGWLRDTLGIPLDRNHVLGHFDIDSVNRPNDPLCLIQDFDGFVATLAPGPAPTPTPGAGGPGYAPPLLVQLVGSPDIYMVLGAFKSHICSPEIFNAMGLDWSAVRIVSDNDPLWALPAWRCR